MNYEDVIEEIEYVKRFKTETNRLEVKSAKEGCPRKIYDTISSFANKYGGIIIFGIDEEKDFEIGGVYDVKDLQKQITSLCSDTMEPSIRPEFLVIEYDNKKLLAVKIDEISQNKKPCYYKPKGLNKGSYIRIGDRDEVMTNYEIYSLLSYRDGVKEDLRLNKRSIISDLDMVDINRYIKRLKEDKPNFAKSSKDKILKLCGIIDNNDNNCYPTLAGTMVFGKYPQAFYPQLFIACAVIPGNELGDVGEMGQRFDDNKRIEGTIEQMLEGTLSFLRKNMKTRVVIDSKTGKRENVLEYPILALREAIANALIHRDYSLQTENAYIQVYMYNDWIVIQNPGTLYGINRLDKLGTDVIMESRNSNIVRILEEKGAVIENRHSGIPTMKREMKKMKLPEPEFKEERGLFKVIFRNGLTSNGKKGGYCDGIEKKEKICEQVSGAQNGESEQQIVKSEQQIMKSEQQIMKSEQQIMKSEQQKGKGEIQRYQDVVLNYCCVPRTAKEIGDFIHISSRAYISYKIISPLIKMGLLEYTNKKCATARNQKYITSDRCKKNV